MWFSSFYRTSGLVLTLLGMLTLVLAGGSFSHAHEITQRGHEHYHMHDHVDGASNHHHDDKTHDESDGPLHCGAPILTLVSQQATLTISGKERVIDNLVADLISRVLSPEPPPPRLA